MIECKSTTVAVSLKTYYISFWNRAIYQETRNKIRNKKIKTNKTRNLSRYCKWMLDFKLYFKTWLPFQLSA